MLRHYYRNLYQKLQTLVQGSRNIDEYFKEMKVLILHADVQEDKEVTMTRFLNSLRSKIAERVEFQHYMEIHQLVDKVVKVEQRFKRRGQTRVNYSVPSPNIRQMNTSDTKFSTAYFSSKSRSDGVNKN